MLLRFAQLTGLGRFERLQHGTDDAVRLRRLSLVYARNASGKTTLTRILAAAGAKDAAQVLAHRRIGAPAPPQVLLKLDGGMAKFDGKAWTGTTPRILVFDRDFVEANVYVGRRQGKEQRKGLLRLALGPDDVALAREIDALAKRGREVVQALKPHEATLRTAARGFGLAVDEFVALMEAPDAAEARRPHQAQLDQAARATEIRKRLRPKPFPLPPAFPLDAIRALLDTDVRFVADAAQAAVDAHVHRLGPRGEGWIREGMGLLQGGGACPFCDQPLAGVALIANYRARFDDAYAQLLASLDQQADAVSALERWWNQVKLVGGSNLAAFGGWPEVSGVARPELGSGERGKDVAFVLDELRHALASKRSSPLQRWPVPEAAAVADRWRTVTEEIAAYNRAVNGANAGIDAFLATLAERDVAAIRRTVRGIEAAVRRHEEDIRGAVDEQKRLLAAKDEIEQLKRVATARIEQGGVARLQAFATKVNRYLHILCADFHLENLGAERVGGEAGAEYTLVVEAGPVTVASHTADGFARILSDGDRSTIALAIFLAHLEDAPELAETVVVFDDPMTSLDHMRQSATAEMVRDIAGRAGQVIVLSHHDPFLRLIALDWSPSQDLVELELHRSKKELRLRGAQGDPQEQRRQIIDAFVKGGDDDDASQVHAEIRVFLEAEVRRRWPHLFDSPKAPLEPAVRKLCAEEGVRSSAGLDEKQVSELQAICTFAQKRHHAQVHLQLDPPDPAEVRGFARRALAWADA